MKSTPRSAIDIGSGKNFRKDWNARAKILGATEASSFGPEGTRAAAEMLASTIAYRVRELLLIQKRERVLDLGCGPGKIAFYLAPSCYELFGVDVSDVMLGEARRRCRRYKNVKFQRNNGRDLALLKTNSFDVCFSYACFIHLPQVYQDRYIKEMLRVVKPGGDILIMTRFGQKHRQFLYTFTGANYSEKRLRALRRHRMVASAKLFAAERHDELATDINTRRWLLITKR